jgi:membrane protein YdbS with pleckstrin-like domain
MIHLDRPHRFAVIGICWIMVIVSGTVSFYLHNEIWIIICQVSIVIFAVYGFYLFMLFMYEFIKQEAWQKFQKELKELRKGE